MKTLTKFAVLGGIAALAVEIYRRQQRFTADESRSFDDGVGMGLEARRPLDPDNRPAEQVADTNSVVTGDAADRQRGPQPQDWRGAQNVLE